MRAAGRRWALRDALVVAQVGLTAVLLVVAGLLLRSLAASQRADVGFRTSGLAMIAFDTDMVRYAPARGEQFWVDVLDRVRALPGVAVGGHLHADPSVRVQLQSAGIPDRQPRRTRRARAARRSRTDRSRPAISRRSASGCSRVATSRTAIVPARRSWRVVNATMARTFWPKESAVGHTITIASTKAQYQIVGVVADHKNHGVLEKAGALRAPGRRAAPLAATTRSWRIPTVMRARCSRRFAAKCWRWSRASC